MSSSPSDLMSYCSWAKKNYGYRESIGDYFYGATLYYRYFYAFSYTIGVGLIVLQLFVALQKNSFLPAEQPKSRGGAIHGWGPWPFQILKISLISIYKRVCYPTCLDQFFSTHYVVINKLLIYQKKFVVINKLLFY